VDPGYRAEGLLALNTVQNTRGDRAAAARFAERLVSDLQSTPGVAGAAVAWPLDSSWTPYVNAVDRPSPRGQEPAVQMSAVVPSFFSTMAIPLRRGRVIDARDRAGATAAVVVNETLVRRLLPPGDPIGRRLSAVGIPELANMEIVGVVGDTLRLGLAGEAAPEVYCSYAQLPAGSPTVVVRAAGGDPLQLGRIVANRIASVDPSVATFGARRVTDSLSDTVGDRRLLSILLGTFAVLALALTAVGIAGVVAFVVARRRWEIGVRMALGADAGSVVRTVVGGVLIPVGVGLACGLVAAVPFTRVIQQYLFGVSPADPSAIAAAAAALLATAFLAALVPARRAARIDPLTALRG
jgi:predicted permease